MQFVIGNMKFEGIKTSENIRINELKISRTNAKYAMIENDGTIGAWNNVGNNPVSKASNKGMILSTGASDSFSSKNIFDLIGNAQEYTMEACTHENCSEENRRISFFAGGAGCSIYQSRVDYRRTLFVRGMNAEHKDIGFRPSLILY